MSTVALGLFTDVFLYGVVVPLLPFLLHDRINIPQGQIQVYVSALLAAYAGASVTFSLPVGWITDKVGSRQLPFLAGSLLLLGATAMLAVADNLGILVTARLLQGVSASIVWTAGLAMVQSAVGPKQTGQAIGTVSSVISVGEVIAPVVGGPLYHRGGIVAVTALSTSILAIDLVMRLLVIDIKETTSDDEPRTATSSRENNDTPVADIPGEAQYKINNPRAVERAVPILYCFRDGRFLTAMILVAVQSLLIGAFDATVPVETQSLFHFSSLEVGLVFIALVVPNLALGPLAGMAVDRYGTKLVATGGYIILVPYLLLLSLPSREILTGSWNIVLFCSILALNGAGMSIISSPGLVEATLVTEKYVTANPDFFPRNGPYAQLYGFSSVFAFAGLTIGPLLGGLVRERFGYMAMTIMLAVISGVTAIVSFLVIGEKMPTSYSE
ncbi:hypothetical protein E4U42_003186 [Claviceps africana]|uniref:Major facilitator superfamily (MFS) profile domain-containing protein n=1 Tax=Claviceps africana TaxID=83212 RepID=A0A8K0NJ19_9HYPO|nr:hypothetical protein E4U42_003186 [Claviceps africana]